jgi:hypothetical protein
MNFYKTFNNDILHCGQVTLPWNQVEYDLESVKNDHSRDASIVSNDSEYDNAQYNEYLQYGYNPHNTVIWKTTNTEPKLTFSWEKDLINQLPLDHAIATVTKQDPGQILPWHEDRFFMIKRLFPEDTRPVWRFLLFLQDWKIGHILQVNDTMLHHWKQGDVVVWQPQTMHVSANIGLETKWTCNITGFLNI